MRGPWSGSLLNVDDAVKVGAGIETGGEFLLSYPKFLQLPEKLDGIVSARKGQEVRRIWRNDGKLKLDNSKKVVVGYKGMGLKTLVVFKRVKMLSARVASRLVRK